MELIRDFWLANRSLIRRCERRRSRRKWPGRRHTTLSKATFQKCNAYIHVRAALEHVWPLLSPTTYKQARYNGYVRQSVFHIADQALLAAPRLQARFWQIDFDLHLLHNVEHMNLLRNSMEEESPFDCRRMMRNWYKNMELWDRPKECDAEVSLAWIQSLGGLKSSEVWITLCPHAPLYNVGLSP